MSAQTRCSHAPAIKVDIAPPRAPSPWSEGQPFVVPMSAKGIALFASAQCDALGSNARMGMVRRPIMREPLPPSRGAAGCRRSREACVLGHAAPGGDALSPVDPRDLRRCAALCSRAEAILQDLVTKVVALVAR